MFEFPILLAWRWSTRPLVVAPSADDTALSRLRAELRQAAVGTAFDEREMVLFTAVRGCGERDDRERRLPVGAHLCTASFG